MRKILITIINYSNEEEVLKYAKLISQQTTASEICLVIINNKESDFPKVDLESELKKIDLSIELYNPKENLGYLNGVLYGYRQYVNRQIINPEWVIISNTDIEIPDNYFFEEFLNKNYEKDIWCVAPSVYSPNKETYDNPHYVTRCSIRKINRIIWIHEHSILAFIYSNLSKIKAKFLNTKKMDSQYVYSAHGCFFALRNEFIEKIKNNSYEGFLYSEEAYIAENISLHNKKCFYDSTLEIIHHENSVTGLLGIKKKSKYIAESLKYIRKEFY